VPKAPFFLRIGGVPSWCGTGMSWWVWCVSCRVIQELPLRLFFFGVRSRWGAGMSCVILGGVYRGYDYTPLRVVCRGLWGKPPPLTQTIKTAQLSFCDETAEIADRLFFM